jgi:hypothetical protein
VEEQAVNIVVYKYAFGAADFVRLEMPAGAQILHIDMQHRQLCAWALVDPERPLEERVLCVAGTGHPLAVVDPARLSFINTVLLAGGDYVFHFFEVRP